MSSQKSRGENTLNSYLSCLVYLLQSVSKETLGAQTLVLLVILQDLGFEYSQLNTERKGNAVGLLQQYMTRVHALHRLLSEVGQKHIQHFIPHCSLLDLLLQVMHCSGDTKVCKGVVSCLHPAFFMLKTSHCLV